MGERKLVPLSGGFALPPSQARGAPASDDTPDGLPTDDVESFRGAGWAFTARPAQEARPVYRDEAGHLLIAGKQMTLKFADGMDSSSIGDYLRRRSLTEVRRTGIRRDRYVVEPARPDSDVVDACRSLEGDDEIAWAEPDLVEAIKGRR